MKGIKSIFKASGLIIVFVLLAIAMIVPSTAAQQSYYYLYNYKGAIGLPGTNTVMFILDEYSDATGERTGKSIYAYCADQSIPMEPGVKYRIKGKASDNLKAILKNTPPQITRAELTNDVNNSMVGETLGTITETLLTDKIVTGTQYAIWHFTNAFSYSESDEDLNRLYQYLITLPGESETVYEPIGISVNPSLCWFDSDGNLTIPFTYNNDFDTITLSQDYEGTVIDYKDGKGTIYIPSSSLGEINRDDTVSLSITVTADRFVNDAYILGVSEEEGPSQDLVAFADKKIEETANVSITKSYEDVSDTAWAYGGEKAIAFNDDRIKISTGNNWGWTNGPLSEGNYVFDLYAGASDSNINNGILVGKLYIEYLNGKVTVRYKLLYGYKAIEEHLFIGNDYLPKKGNGYTNSPGQLNELYNTEYSINGDIYIAAHLKVVNIE